MDNVSRQAHWEKVYSRKTETELSWFQETPAPSLDLIAATGATTGASIVDVGGGSSRLVDALLDKGLAAITVLDLSASALAAARARLGARAGKVQWVVGDITEWQPAAAVYDLWHDRATLHFLTEEADRAAYVDCLAKALRPGGHAIIATFALDGPERCSGLPVVRYDAESLLRLLGNGFELVDSRCHVHRTPWGTDQRFQFSLLRRRS
jgi:SAM-dependent methyltransferase